jgi:hypothetical protein
VFYAANAEEDLCQKPSMADEALNCRIRLLFLEVEEDLC